MRGGRAHACVSQGFVSYDLIANEDYLEAFALDSASMRAYFRGNLQVSGDELAPTPAVNVTITLKTTLDLNFTRR